MKKKSKKSKPFRNKETIRGKTLIIKEMKNAKQFMTLAEVAEEFHVKKSWLYRLVSKDKIPFYKPNGGKLFFIREDIENFMTSRIN